MQEVKAVHEKVRNGHNIQLPNKLADSDDTGPKQGSIYVPNRLHGRALEEHVALIPKNVMISQEGSQPRAAARLPSCPSRFRAGPANLALLVSAHLLEESQNATRTLQTIPTAHRAQITDDQKSVMTDGARGPGATGTWLDKVQSYILA